MAIPTLPYVMVDGVGLAPDRVVVPLSITVGRSDPTGQPNANACTFTYRGPTLPSYLCRGAVVQVDATTAGAADLWVDVWDDIWNGEGGTGVRRFTGNITDVTVDPSPTERMVYAQITCIGTLVNLSDQYIGDEPWPVETDSARTARIAALNRSQYLIVNDGSPDLRLRARDVDRRKVLELLHLFAGSVGSIVWEYPDGSVHYQRYDWRDVPDGALYLPASAIVDTAQWAQSSDQLIDRVRVEYGDEPTEGDRPAYIAGDGRHETLLAGEVADLATATAIGDAVLARWGRTDVWDVPEIETSAALLDQATYTGLLSLMPSDPLRTGNLTLIPSPATAGEGLWFIEGWTETWDRSDGGVLTHDIRFAVTDIRLFASHGAKIDLHLTLSQTTWGFGQTSTIKATVTVVGGGPLPEHGTITMYMDGYSPVIPYDLTDYTTPPDSVTWDLLATGFPPGDHIAQATYSGAAGEWQPSSTNAVQVWVTAGTGGGITARTGTTTPRVGDMHTIDIELWVPATLPDGWPAYPMEGQVYCWLNDGTGWGLYTWFDASVGEPAALTYPVTGRDLRWEFHYMAYHETNEQTQIVAISNQVWVWPLSRFDDSAVYLANQWATYQADGTLTAEVDLWQGHWDASGDYRALAWFTIDPDRWVGYTITKVEVFLFAEEFGNGESGTVRIGSHAQPADPATADPVGTITHRTDVSQWLGQTGRWVDITSWGKALITGQVTGIAIGPAEQDLPELRAKIQGGSAAKTWDAMTGTWDEQVTSWDAVDAALAVRVVGFKWD